MKNLKKRIAIALVLAMVATAISATAFAAGSSDEIIGSGTIEFSEDDTLVPGPVDPEDLPPELTDDYDVDWYTNKALAFADDIKIMPKAMTYDSINAVGYIAQGPNPSSKWTVKVAIGEFTGTDTGKKLLGAALTMSPNNNKTPLINTHDLTAPVQSTKTISATDASPSTVLTGGYGYVGASWVGALNVPSVPDVDTYSATMTWYLHSGDVTE